MDPRQSSAYEPYRHAGHDADETEKAIGPDGDEQMLLRQQAASHEPAPSSRGGHRRQHSGGVSRPGFQGTRTVLRCASLLFASSILALQVYSIYSWLSTRHDVAIAPDGTRMRLWAILDVGPTWTVLATAILAVVVHLLAFGSLCGCCRSVRESPSHVWAVYLSSVLVIAAWIAGLIYYKVADSKGAKKSSWDIWSWTCQKKSDNSKLVPWNALCTMNTYTFYASIIVVLLEIANLALFVAAHRGFKASSIYDRAQSATRSGYRRYMKM